MFSSKTLVDLNSGTKLRCLKLGERTRLSSILTLCDWQNLAGVIRDPDDLSKPLYTSDDIRTLESQKEYGRNPVDALLEHWSTCGKNQPNLNDLLLYLKEAKLLKAAHFVETELLKRDISDENTISEELDTILKNKNDNSPEANFDELLEGVNLDQLTVYPFEDLSDATKSFNERNGFKIGEGTYGTVFKAKISDKFVAIKKLKNYVDKQFFTELNILSRFKHKNLLPLLGFSLSKSSCCLVYEYMENGSLQDRLACLGNTPPLSFEIRMKIAYEAALGINHLHTFEKEPRVHRDIKSGNLLLDKNFSIKVGDFGLVRIGDSNASSTVAVTAHVVGTSVYMAREAFNGDVSPKLDTFSYGVVLLELLTGLPPYDNNRDDRDLTTFMEGCDDISPMLDKKVVWDIESARELYKIAGLCLTMRKKNRPELREVLPDLQRCCSAFISNEPE